jgi:UrcA family protein
MNNLIRLTTFAVLAASSFVAAAADSDTAPQSMVVRFGDLDTAHVPGAAALYGRLKFAAESVCRELGLDRTQKLRGTYDRCVRKAIGDAVVKVDRPALTTYAAAHGVVQQTMPVELAQNQ